MSEAIPADLTPGSAALLAPVPVASGLERLRDAIRRTGLSVALVELPGGRVLESARAATGLMEPRPDGARLSLAAPASSPKALGQAFELLANGAVDACRIRAAVPCAGPAPGGAAETVVNVSLRVIARDAANAYVLALIAPARADGAIDNAPSSLDTLVGPLLELVHTDDVADLLSSIADVATNHAQIALEARMLDGSGVWRRLRVALDGQGNGQLRADIGPADYRDRLTDLEQRLARIAHEVDAAGLFRPISHGADPAQYPGLADLTPRQSEILTRLLRGERVPTISRGMHLAASTVRNHLTTIYRKVGVHSQPELLERLRTTAPT